MKTLCIIGKVLRKRLEKTLDFMENLIFVFIMFGILALPGILVAALFFGTSPKTLYYGGCYSIIIAAWVFGITSGVKKFLSDYKEEAKYWN